MSSPGGFEAGRVSIRVLPDTSKFREALLKDLKKLEKQLKVEIPVEFDTKHALTQMAALKRAMDRIDRKIDINANVNKDLDKLSSNLSKVTQNANSTADGFGNMSRMGLIVTGVIVLLAPAIGLIATLIAALPSLLLAGGAAFGAIALGIDGFKKAAEAAQPMLDRLKKSLSGNFEKNLTPAFKQLNKLTPILDNGLNRVADGINKIVTNLVKLLTSTDGMKQLAVFLGETGKFLSNLSPAINEGTKTFLTLATEASRQFGLLNTVLLNFSVGFNRVVQKLTISGDLERAIAGLAKVFEALFKVFNDVFEVGVRLFGEMAGPLTTFIQGFGRALVALMPILTVVSNLVFTVLGEALNALAPVFEALTPVIKELGQILTTLLVGAIKVLAPLLLIIAQIVGTVLMKAFTAIQPFIPKLIDFFTRLAQLIGEFLLRAFETLSPFLDKFLEFFVKLLLVLEPLIPPLMDLAATVLQALLDVLAAVAPHLGKIVDELLPRFLDAVIPLVEPITRLIEALILLIPPLTDLAVWILEHVIPAMQGLFEIVADIWPAISQIIGGVLKIITGLIKTFVGLVTGDWELMWDGIQDTAEGAGDILKGQIELGLRSIVDLFVGLPASIVRGMGDLGSKLFESGRSLIRGFIDGIKNMVGSAVQAAQDMLSQVRSFFPFSPAKKGPFSGSGYTTFSGRALMEDWAKGIRSGEAAAVAAVNSAMAATQGSMELQASIASDGYGSIGDKVERALAGWNVIIDANGVARLVNNVNRRNARR